jgi:hypothetical protein
MAYSDEVLADSPYSYLRLNDVSGTVAADSSGNNNVGTYVGAPTMGVKGLIATDTDTAIQTTGNQQVTLPYTLPTNTFTLELWWKWTADGTATAIWRDHTAASGTGYALGVSSGGVSMRIAGTDHTVTTANYCDGVRHHFVLTYDGVTATFYIDGVQVDQWTKSSATRPATPLHIAYNGTNNNQYQLGVYDEVAVYGTVLSASRIAAHYTVAGGLPSDARVETLYLESMTAGVPNVQVEASFTEAMVVGLPAVRVEASFIEAMTMVEPAHVETVYAEAMLNYTPPSQIESVYAEVLLASQSRIEVETVYTEVLYLQPTVQRFVGWGVPI